MGLCSGFDFKKDLGICSQVDIGYDYEKVLFYNFDLEPIPLDGLNFTGEIKDDLAGSVLINLAVVGTDQETGFYIPDPSSGEIHFIIKKEDDLPEGFYPYSFTQINIATGDEEIFMQGEIQFFNRGF